jgi:hypothetical protein
MRHQGGNPGLNEVLLLPAVWLTEVKPELVLNLF